MEDIRGRFGFGYDRLGRPTKDLYAMKLCFEVSTKSLDKSSKCGCVVTDQEGGILTTGYNSPMKGSIDDNVPQTRPEKYLFFEHSERNAIYNAARNGTALNNSVFYVTGFPCVDCLRGIVQVGSKKIVYGPLTAKMSEDKDYIAAYKELLMGICIEIKRFRYDEALFQEKPEVREICAGRSNIKLEKQIKGVLRNA